jgi:transposase-like protein
MSFGYSVRVVTLNNAAGNTLGVQLGRTCIEHNVPVSAVAGRLGVSRQTVYSWFTGASTPRSSKEETIRKFMSTLQR